MVLYFEPKPGEPSDSGFSLLHADAPRPGPAADTTWEAVCLECAFDEWPGIGRGLDLAREHGSAELWGPSGPNSSRWQP